MFSDILGNKNKASVYVLAWKDIDNKIKSRHKGRQRIQNLIPPLLIIAVICNMDHWQTEAD